MQRYNKLIAGVIGNLMGIIAAWVAVNMTGMAECSVLPDGTESCTLLGLTTTQLTAAVMLLINALFIERSPRNAD